MLDARITQIEACSPPNRTEPWLISSLGSPNSYRTVWSQTTPNRAASGKGLAGEERMAVDRGRGGNYYADACCLSGRDGNTRLPAVGSARHVRQYEGSVPGDA